MISVGVISPLTRRVEAVNTAGQYGRNAVVFNGRRGKNGVGIERGFSGIVFRAEYNIYKKIQMSRQEGVVGVLLLFWGRNKC